MKTYNHNGSHQLWQKNLQLQKIKVTEKELDWMLKAKVWMWKIYLTLNRCFFKVGGCEKYGTFQWAAS